ncbi:hypothetical protein ACIQ7Q_14335 [Streptomyces sp. NPDC096176]|uniref:hypothetical protein n=1 Tax=Streptomyces sp. NPDC096176 TaxID=3366079 RepID=UPI0038298314
MLSGAEVQACCALELWQSQGRDCLTLETSLPGVFAAGAVRGGSVKRVARAVGEGAMSIHFVHRYLGRTAPPNSPHIRPKESARLA